MAETAYDSDFFEWTQDQAAKLRRLADSRVNLPVEVDFENLAEEVESLGNSDRKSLQSHSRVILEHLIKLEFSPARDSRSGWRASVLNARAEIEVIFEDSPSLKNAAPSLIPSAYGRARRSAVDMMRSFDELVGEIPTNCPYDPDSQILSPDWFPPEPKD